MSVSDFILFEFTVVVTDSLIRGTWLFRERLGWVWFEDGNSTRLRRTSIIEHGFVEKSAENIGARLRVWILALR